MTTEIEAVFRAAGATGFLHAREIDGDREVSAGADEPVVLASVFKIPVAVVYASDVEAGRLDPAERTRITALDRIGGIGTAGCAEDVEMCWRDLARFMLTMSDNAATDVLLRRVGLDRVNSLLTDLGLHRSRLIGGCLELFASVHADLGLDPSVDLEAAFDGATEDQVRSLSILDPKRTSASTPREMTSPLASIWRDEAASPAACAEVREIMGNQIWPHRLSSGFPSDVEVAAKTGTLPSVRNEAGVVTYPDGGRYAVAVFTVADSLIPRQPAVDATIGTAAKLAVDQLRS